MIHKFIHCPPESPVHWNEYREKMTMLLSLITEEEHKGGLLDGGL